MAPGNTPDLDYFNNPDFADDEGESIQASTMSADEVDIKEESVEAPIITSSTGEDDIIDLTGDSDDEVPDPSPFPQSNITQAPATSSRKRSHRDADANDDSDERSAISYEPRIKQEDEASNPAKRSRAGQNGTPSNGSPTPSSSQRSINSRVIGSRHYDPSTPTPSQRLSNFRASPGRLSTPFGTSQGRPVSSRPMPLGPQLPSQRTPATPSNRRFEHGSPSSTRSNPTPSQRSFATATANSSQQTAASPVATPLAPPIPALALPGLPVVQAIPLDPEQRDVVDLIVGRNNVFYTGAAGAGKSVVTTVAVEELRALGLRVRVMAPTGKAALAIGGGTTWTFPGWYPGSMHESIRTLEGAARYGEVARKRMQETDVIIIDEISMMENHLFERLDRVMQAARNDHRPFGGVQVVVTGDFYQLPPINPFEHCLECGVAMRHKKGRTEHQCPRGHGMLFDSEKWVFASDAWEECRFINRFLHGIHRQTDPRLKRILQTLRRGDQLSSEDRALLLDHPCDVDGAVKLFSGNKQVHDLNTAELQKLPGQERVYHCLDFFKHNEEHKHLKKKRERSPTDGNLMALNNHQFEAELKLKVGMPVLLMVNLDLQGGLVNGSQGEIIDFVTHDKARAANAKRSHDVDGDQNDWQERNAIEGIPTYGGKWNTLQAEQIKAFLAQKRNKDKVWPVVRFSNGKVVTIFPNCRIQELGDDPPYSLISRTQIPLTAAWAITIHRSQGMTLEKVEVDLSQTFVTGQEYVALSRARSLEGLKVTGLKENFGGINEDVKFIERTFGRQ